MTGTKGLETIIVGSWRRKNTAQREIVCARAAAHLRGILILSYCCLMDSHVNEVPAASFLLDGKNV